MRLRELGGFVAVLTLMAFVAQAQTYEPGEIDYGGIRLQFSGQLVTAGTCTGPFQAGFGISEVRCQVVEGNSGIIELTAVRTPAGLVNMRVESVPTGWPGSLWVQQMGQWVDSRNPVASGWGTVTAQYRFTVPAGSTGRAFTLRFKAWTAGVLAELELRVILEVVRPTAPPPTEPTVPLYGPFTGTTDTSGSFEIPIPSLPNTSVTGKLTECTVRPLPRAQVSVTLVPKPGVTAIARADQIGAVRVSSPGYGEVEIVQLRLSSSMDMFGRVSTTVDLGTVCLRPAAPPVTPPPSTYGPITGRTDADGRFTGTLAPGVTVTGRLTECTVKPLPNQEFTLTPLPKGEAIAGPEDIAGFTFSVPGYAATTVTKFSTFSLFGLTSYGVGDVCLRPPCTLVIRGMVDDGAPHGSPPYPVSKSKVWLFVLEEGDRLPLDPLSLLARRPTAETSTNHTEERSFDGTEFRRVEEARYEFRLQWLKSCPPWVVAVSLLWYDESDLMAVSSENLIGGRLVPVYLAKVVTPSGDPYLPHCGTAGIAWQRTGPNEYTATADFSYGRDPLAEHSARVIGVPGRGISEEWDRKGADADDFMRNCAHFYFYSYKTLRYFQGLAEALGVGLKPVAVEMFTGEGTSCSSVDTPLGGLAGSPRVIADAQVFIETADSSPPWGGNKPDNSVWHEMGHYWWLQIYARFVRGIPGPDKNHGGYDNSSTTDSLQEGFAEFTSCLTAEHYGDPRAYMYRWGGHNTNLELDMQLWGPFGAAHDPNNPDGDLAHFKSFDPSAEEFAIAGLLWDLHDGGDLRFDNVRETKARGVISTQIQTEDVVSLTDVEIYRVFKRQPLTLKDLHDLLQGAFPRDGDGDGVSDVGEVFIAHGAFADVAVRNLKHDPGEAIGPSGSRILPTRPVREGKPLLAQAYILVSIVSARGGVPDMTGATLHVDMRFAEPFDYYNYEDEGPLTADRVYFVMPTNFYPVTAFITVEVPGVGRSAPLEITAQEYWRLFQQAGEAGLCYLLEHTFILGS